MPTIFLYGTLRAEGLRRTVLGAEVAGRPARLRDHAVVWAAEGRYPLVREEPGAVVEGLVIEADGAALDRMDWYEGLFDYPRRPVLVETASGPVEADLYWPPEDGPRPGRPFDLADWEARDAALAVAVAEDLLALRGAVPEAAILRRLPSIAARSQARLNAHAAAQPATLRREVAPGDVTVEDRRVPYSAFFSVEEYDLRHVRFAGGRSERLVRACFVMSDAVVVLPYDPVQDLVLLVEQVRAGPLGRGDPRPWTLETAAGRIDAGESPAEAARREAQEETGLALDRLIEVPMGYASPGAVTEYLYGFIGVCRLELGASGTHGAEDEGEDIRTHTVPFDRLMDLIATGEINTAPLVLIALHLAARRAALRAEVGA